jgi:AcrR family transcriptional regulator
MNSLSHNLVGQRLGRKGRDTRERILAATDRLLAGPPDTAISLSAVAREASLAMTTLYIYFNDLTELLLAVLDPVLAQAEDAYIAHLRMPWPDDSLGQHCLSFVETYREFWVRNSRILHLRNSLADSLDARMRQHRIDASWPLIELLVRQMEGDPAEISSPASAMATVLLTSIERVITMTTDAWVLQSRKYEYPPLRTRHLLEAEARLLELGIGEGREASRCAVQDVARLA